MKLRFVYLLFGFGTIFSFADIVQFTDQVKCILSSIAESCPVEESYDIQERQSRTKIRRLFKRNDIGVVPIYVKILLQNEGKTIDNIHQQLIILELLCRIKNALKIWSEKFKLFVPDHMLDEEFLKSVRLIDPFYH